MVNVPRIYLGDGVYARFDGYQVVIWTSNGIDKSAEIALEPEVLRALVQYDADVRKQITEKGNDT
jgi:hypothetical protein